MASKATTRSFIHEFQLVTSPKEDRILEVRFNAGRNLYNACLSEALTRLSAMRGSDAWKTARNMPHGKARTAAFQAINEKFGYGEYSLHKYAARVSRACWIGGPPRQPDRPETGIQGIHRGQGVPVREARQTALQTVWLDVFP